MEDLGTGAGHRAPPEVLRRLELGQRVAARAVSHARVADAVLRRRAPKLLSASTRIAPPVELHPLGDTGSLPRPSSRWSPAASTSAPTWETGRNLPADAGEPAARPAAPAQPLSEEAATFRSLMQKRYDMPDEMFDAMFGGNTPVYQGAMPNVPPADVPDEEGVDEPARVSEDSAATAMHDVTSEPAAPATDSPAPAPARAGAPAQPGARGARIVEGPRPAEAPGPPRRPAGRPGKRLSSRPAADRPAAPPPAPAPSRTPSPPSPSPSSPSPPPRSLTGPQPTPSDTQAQPAASAQPEPRAPTGGPSRPTPPAPPAPPAPSAPLVSSLPSPTERSAPTPPPVTPSPAQPAGVPAQPAAPAEESGRSREGTRAAARRPSRCPHRRRRRPRPRPLPSSRRPRQLLPPRHPRPRPSPRRRCIASRRRARHATLPHLRLHPHLRPHPRLRRPRRRRPHPRPPPRPRPGDPRWPDVPARPRRPGPRHVRVWSAPRGPCLPRPRLPRRRPGRARHAPPRRQQLPSPRPPGRSRAASPTCSGAGRQPKRPWRRRSRGPR